MIWEPSALAAGEKSLAESVRLRKDTPLPMWLCGLWLGEAEGVVQLGGAASRPAGTGRQAGSARQQPSQQQRGGAGGQRSSGANYSLAS